MAHANTNSRILFNFNFEGQFLGFVSHDRTLKHISLRVLSEEIQIKLPKAVRLSVGKSLQPGEFIQVIGVGKFDRHDYKLKLKATQLIPLTENFTQTLPVTSISPVSLMAHGSQTKLKVRPNIKVLLCQKSGCLKRGGKGLYEALEQTLRDRDLQHRITIERTGCLKRCASAPNLTIMPGNHRYKDVRLETLPQIVNAIEEFAGHGSGS